MEVVIMRGPSGAGKTTYVDKFLRGYFVCSADAFFASDLRGEYDFNPTLLPQAHSWCMSNYLDFLRNRRTWEASYCGVVVDNTNIYRWEVTNYLKAAGLVSMPRRIVEVVPRTVSQIRDCATGAIHGCPAEVIYRQSIEFEQLGPEWCNIPVESHRFMIKSAPPP